MFSLKIQHITVLGFVYILVENTCVLENVTPKQTNACSKVDDRL